MPEMAERQNGGCELMLAQYLPPSADGTISHGPSALGLKKIERISLAFSSSSSSSDLICIMPGEWLIYRTGGGGVKRGS